MDDLSFDFDSLDDCASDSDAVPAVTAKSKAAHRQKATTYECCALCDWRRSWGADQSDYHITLHPLHHGSGTRVLLRERVRQKYVFYRNRADVGRRVMCRTRRTEVPICSVCEHETDKVLSLLKGNNGWMKKLRNQDERREIKRWRERYNRRKCTLAERNKSIAEVESRSRERVYRETFFAKKHSLIAPEVINPENVYDHELSGGYSYHDSTTPPRQDVNHKLLHEEEFRESVIGTGPGEKRESTTVARRAAAAWKEYGPIFEGWS